MRRAALLAFLLASCSAGRREEIIPRYAILATFGPENAMYPSVHWLAERRFGQIRPFRTEQLPLVRSWLRDFDPTYVAVVLRPEELDLNFHLAFLDLACRLDDDPFPDFAFGYLLASNPADLQRQMKNLQGVETKLEKRLRRFTEFEPGAAASTDAIRPISWTVNLPLRRLAVKEGDAEFLRKNLDAVERAGFLLLSGKGWPEGIRGLPASEIHRFKLDSTVVFSAVDYSGAAGAGFDQEGGFVRRWTVPPDRSVPLALVRSGAAAQFAPLGKTRPEAAEFEWTDAVLSDGPLGGVMKHAYDRAILRAGGPPSPPGLVEARRPSVDLEDPLLLAAGRVLLGDPSLHPYTCPVRRPIEHVRTAPAGRTPEGDLVLETGWRVAAYDCEPFFRDPEGGQRIHLRIPLPPGTRRARAELSQCRSRDQDVPAAIAAQAFETWRGEPLLHVLLRGPALAVEDLFVHLRIAHR